MDLMDVKCNRFKNSLQSKLYKKTCTAYYQCSKNKCNDIDDALDKMITERAKLCPSAKMVGKKVKLSKNYGQCITEYNKKKGSQIESAARKCKKTLCKKEYSAMGKHMSRQIHGLFSNKSKKTNKL